MIYVYVHALPTHAAAGMSCDHYLSLRLAQALEARLHGMQTFA